MTKHDILLDVQHLSHVFPLTKQVSVKALDDISFQIHRGEIFGLVGESGSGKSTAARCAMGILQPSGGHIFYNGVDLCDKAACRANKKMLQTTRQMIFQDSASSLDPHMTVCDSITEPMRHPPHRPAARHIPQGGRVPDVLRRPRQNVSR